LVLVDKGIIKIEDFASYQEMAAMAIDEDDEEGLYDEET